MRLLPMLVMPAILALVAGCEPPARLVYVLESPQEVTLTTSASALKVQQGETVVLRVARRTKGKWKQIPLAELSRGQCWLYRPPPEWEPEVAHSVQWDVVPQDAVSFNSEYRLDNTRAAIMMAKGTITLTPLSPVKCEPDRVVTGPSIDIEVS